MFFTQEDYRNIERWLKIRSVKDTDFSEANFLDDRDIVTIVQDGHNKKIHIKDLVNHIFKLGVSDFLNITDKYDAPNISLDEAIKLIPCKARKAGQVITFLNKDNNWEIYQFKGVLNQWNILDFWDNLFDWEKFIIDSILPDEEDLTKSPSDGNGNSYLSLKDRKYNPEEFSGLGRIILRKNIVEIEDPTYGNITKNILYQDMFIQDNTVYEIRYDFDLNNQTVVIPEGSILLFTGGAINNGTLNCSKGIFINYFNGTAVLTGDYKFWNHLVDNEDIIRTEEGHLKFADKEYSPDDFNGLGRVYLRKNIIDGKNILTQDKINKPNTIYIIQYDFDLNGNTITIPENCALKFEGGSLRNGNLIGNNTNISNKNSLIFNNINFKGIFEYIKISWFNTRISSNIQCFKIIDVDIDFNWVVDKKYTELNCNHDFSLIGNNRIINLLDNNIVSTTYLTSALYSTSTDNPSYNINIENINIISNIKSSKTNRFCFLFLNNIKTFNCENVNYKSGMFFKMHSDSIVNVGDLTFTNCHIETEDEFCLEITPKRITNDENFYLETVNLFNCSFAEKSRIWVGLLSIFGSIKNINIDNCKFQGNYGNSNELYSENTTISNSYILNSGLSNEKFNDATFQNNLNIIQCKFKQTIPQIPTSYFRNNGYTNVYITNCDFELSSKSMQIRDSKNVVINNCNFSSKIEDIDATTINQIYAIRFGDIDKLRLSNSTFNYYKGWRFIPCIEDNINNLDIINCAFGKRCWIITDDNETPLYEDLKNITDTAPFQEALVSGSKTEFSCIVYKPYNIPYGVTESIPQMNYRNITGRYLNEDTSHELLWNGFFWNNEDGTDSRKVTII